MPSSRRLLLAGAVLPALLATPALAQNSAQPAGETGDPVAIQDIVVTARRKAENLQSVPIAITALSADSVRERNIQTAADLQKIVPSLSVATAVNRTTESFSIRGLGASQGAQVATTAVNSVQTYFNEVPGQAGVGSYYDLQNVQVLKGPQGTLFGRNTTGGAILFETRRPTFSLDGYVQIQGGTHGLYGIEGALNVPVIEDVLAIRVAGIEYHRDGFTTNYATRVNPDNSFTSLGTQKLDDRDYQSGRISILFQPTSSLRNTTIYNYFQSNRNGDAAVLRTFNRDAVFAADLRGALPASVIAAFGLNSPLPLTLAGGPPTSGLSTDFVNTVLAAKAAGRFSFFSDATLQAIQARQDACGIRCVFDGFLQSYHAKTHLLSNLTDWTVSDTLTIRNIFGYNHQQARYAFDYEGTPLDLIGIKNRKADGNLLSQDNFSEELQLQGHSFDNMLDWVIGGFAEWSRPGGKSQTVSSTIGGLNIQRPVAFGHTYAIFAQGTLDLRGILPGLKFTAGGRYTWDKRAGTAQQFNPITGNCSLGGAPGNGKPFNEKDCRIDQAAKFRQPTWTFSLDYQATRDLLFYVTSRRGYKPGGFNFGAPSTQYLTYDPETVTDIELGAKTDWSLGGDAKLRANVALYKNWYKNIIQQTGITVNGQATSVIINGGKARIQGVEFEGALIPFTGFELTGFYSYTDAKYPSSSPLVFTFSPKNKFNLSARYELPLPESIGRVIPSVSYSHQSSFYGLNTPLVPFAKLPGYGTLDVRIDWNEIGGKPLDASLFITNATNKHYVQGRLTTYESLGVVADTWGEPRMIGAQLRYRFGTSARR